MSDDPHQKVVDALLRRTTTRTRLRSCRSAMTRSLMW